MVHHPRDPGSRGLSRRDFLRRSLAAGVALPTASAILAACGGNGSGGGDGGGDEDLTPRFGTADNPATLQLYDDNPAIESNLEPEEGPLVLYNWEQYIWKRVLRDFSKKYGIETKVETFYNMEQAIQKFQSGEIEFDIFFPTIDYLPKLVAAKMLQPLNHDYLPNLKNVWPELQDPYYDKGSQYSLPYTVYTTGIAWRKDIVPVEPEELSASSNPYEIFWNADYAGEVGIYDAYREALSLGMYRDLLDQTNLNESDPAVIAKAKDRLIELIDLVDVKTTIDGAYSGIPEGKFGLHQAWSGDIQAGPFYATDPKKDAPLFRYYWPARDGFGGTIDNDMYAIPKTAKNPVLAHLFLNFMMDEFNALKNWSWLGYQVPFNVVNPDTIFEESYPGLEGWFVWDYEAPPGKHWDNLKPTIVTEEDVKIGKRAIGLEVDVDSIWQDAYSEFKAGA
ncbi:MAG TPA: spermidine/putrescine ABC transporter substrate-binding protein [Actinomycetota bacterium]|nr:spermidine/putrescine ABC transporter substrate-binding protein [Actinomycetota bacterium]